MSWEDDNFVYSPQSSVVTWRECPDDGGNLRACANLGLVYCVVCETVYEAETGQRVEEE